MNARPHSNPDSKTEPSSPSSPEPASPPPATTSATASSRQLTRRLETSSETNSEASSETTAETSSKSVSDTSMGRPSPEPSPRKTPHDFIEEGQGLVHSLASRIHLNLPVRVDLDDLVSYGQLGLAEAAREFDPARGVQFTTFAYYRIRGAIYDGVSKMSWTSRARLNRLRYLQRANEVLQQEEESEGAGEASRGSLQDEANWFSRVTEKLAVVYLASQATDEEGHSRLLETADKPMPSPMEVREVNARLHALIDALPLDASRLIRTIYFDGLTLTEAAQQLGISKSWASRVHARTLDNLAQSLRRIGAD
jgi:RNA polymerase sigma factor FliA